MCIRFVAPACGAYLGGGGGGVTEIFPSVSVVRPRDCILRNSDMNLNLPLPKTEYLKKIIGYRVPNYGTHFIS